FLAGEVLPQLDATIRADVQKRTRGSVSDAAFARICHRNFEPPQPSEPLVPGLVWCPPRSIDVVDGDGNIRTYCRDFTHRTRVNLGRNAARDERATGPAPKRLRRAKPLPHSRKVDRDGDVIFVDADDDRSVRSEESNLTTNTDPSTTASLRAAVNDLGLKSEKGKEKELVPHHHQLAAAAAAVTLPPHLKEKFAKRPATDDAPPPPPAPDSVSADSSPALDTSAQEEPSAASAPRAKRTLKLKVPPAPRRASRLSRKAAAADLRVDTAVASKASTADNDTPAANVGAADPGAPSAVRSTSVVPAVDDKVPPSSPAAASDAASYTASPAE
ncbi:hypothetical protein HDU96_003611, partial [Phlyctochytrium bullatum]